MLKKCSILFSLVFCLYNAVKSQPVKPYERTVDSLNSVFKTLSLADAEQAKQCAAHIVAISHKHNYTKGLGLGYMNSGIASLRACAYDSAMACYLKALPLLIKVNDKLLVAKTYMGIGTVYNFTGKQEKALEFYFKALKLYEALDEKVFQVKALDNIGMVYENQRKFDKALDIYERCRQINEITKDEDNIASNYGNLGKVFFQLENYSEAIKYHTKELEIIEKLQDSTTLCYTYDNLSSAYAASGNLQQGLFYQQKALSIYELMGDKAGVANSYCNLGNIYYLQNNFKKALEYLNRSAALAESIHSNIILNSCYGSLVEVYLKMNDHKNAFDYLERSGILKDTIYNQESIRQMAEVEALYKNEKLANEKLQAEKANIALSNDQLKTMQQRNYIALTSFILIIIIVSGFYIFSQKRKREEEKNRINAMLLSEEKERTRIARELHDGLGQLLSTARLNAAALEDSVEKEDEHLLANTLQLIDQSVTEVRSVSHNLMPQMLMDKGLLEAVNELIHTVNSSKAFNITFNHSEFNATLTKSVEVAIYRVVQEVLNNMIKHSTANKIEIKLVNNKNDLKILISDNGKGFDTTLIEKSEGLGWRNILTRLSLINGKFGVDSNPGQGTTVNIEVAL